MGGTGNWSCCGWIETGLLCHPDASRRPDPVLHERLSVWASRPNRHHIHILVALKFRRECNLTAIGREFRREFFTGEIGDLLYISPAGRGGVYIPPITKGQHVTLDVGVAQQSCFSRRITKAQHKENNPRNQPLSRYSPIHSFLLNSIRGHRNTFP